ncbi:MAG: hypothetical protein LBG60_09390 [Bifidobacteriaceae bacterium]|nr:hypothetical protein [Bifidobacteriaceae bacterium]
MCIVEKGFEVSEVFDASIRGMLTFVIEGGEEAKVDEAYDECYDAHLATIESQWFHANIPTGAERDAMFAELIACLGENGVTGVTAAMAQQEIVDAIADQVLSDDSKFGASLFCMDEHAALFPEDMYPSR